MKRAAMLLAVVAVVVVTVAIVNRRQGPEVPPSTGGEAVPAEPATGGAPSAGELPEAPGRPRAPVVKRTVEPPKEPFVVETMVAHAEALNDEDATVQDDLSVVGELISAYIRYIGTGPEGGLNEEIVACLQGKNPKKLILLGKGHARVNRAGELLDRFGTPYYFHPVSAQEIEIRSAGPDKLLWSKDDVLPQ